MLLTVLFSNIFWILYIILGLISGTITLRKYAPKIFSGITTGTYHNEPMFSKETDFSEIEIFVVSVVLFFNFILWPFMIVVWFIIIFLKLIGFINSKTIFPAFKNILIALDKAIPKYIIVKEEDESK